MNWILLWQQSEPTYLYDIYFAKIAWCISQKVNEVNPILNCKRNKPTDLYDLFFCKNCMVSEIQMKRDEFKLFFWKRIKPTLPYHLPLKKIAKWGRDKCKWGEYNIFSKAASPYAPMICFFSYRKMDDVWELNVNEVDTIFFATAVCLYCPMTYFCIIF